jgi:hypothetical protein
MAANQEDLLAYLSHALPPIPLPPNLLPGPNTSNPRSQPQDSTHVGNWATFTYQNIMQAWEITCVGLAAKGCGRKPLREAPAS